MNGLRHETGKKKFCHDGIRKPVGLLNQKQGGLLLTQNGSTSQPPRDRLVFTSLAAITALDSVYLLSSILCFLETGHSLPWLVEGFRSLCGRMGIQGSPPPPPPTILCATSRVWLSN